MLHRNLMLGLFCGSLGAFGCSGTPEVDGGTDTGGEVNQPPGMTYDYVVRTLTIDDSDAVELGHTGFNVDGLFSGPTDADGCNHEDFFSLHDRDQHRPSGCAMGTAGCTAGVDNQLPTVINSVQAAAMGMDLRMVLADQIRNGGVSILIRVADVNDFVNDPSVNVRIWQGFPEFADCSTAFSGSAQYSVSSASLRAGGTNIDTDASFNFPGSIVGGRLIVTTGTGTFRLPLPEIMGARINLDLNQAQVRLSLSNDGMTGTNGDMGGYVSGNALVAAVIAIVPDFGPAVEAILSGVVDVRLPGMTMCVDRSNPTMTQFGGISMGLGISTVRATIRPAAASARTMGMCGFTAAGDGGRG